MELLPIGELFKKSFTAWWQNMWNFVGIVLFGFLGLAALLPFGIAALIISYVPFSHADYNINIILVDILLGLIGIFFCILFGLWSRVALFFAVKDPVAGIKASLSSSWKNIASFFWVSLLAGLATLGGFFLLVIPGIIFSVWFIFSMYVFVFEGLKGTAALKRSKQLVAGNWWSIFGRSVVLGLVVALVSWIRVFGPIINIFFTGPFAVVYMYMLYEDVKRTKS